MNILTAQNSKQENAGAIRRIAAKIYVHIEESRWFNARWAVVDVVVIGICLYLWV